MEAKWSSGLNSQVTYHAQIYWHSNKMRGRWQVPRFFFFLGGGGDDFTFTTMEIQYISLLLYLPLFYIADHNLQYYNHFYFFHWNVGKGGGGGPHPQSYLHPCRWNKIAIWGIITDGNMEGNKRRCWHKKDILEWQRQRQNSIHDQSMRWEHKIMVQFGTNSAIIYKQHTNIIKHCSTPLHIYCFLYLVGYSETDELGKKRAREPGFDHQLWLLIDRRLVQALADQLAGELVVFQFTEVGGSVWVGMDLMTGKAHTIIFLSGHIKIIFCYILWNQCFQFKFL